MTDLADATGVSRLTEATSGVDVAGAPGGDAPSDPAADDDAVEPVELLVQLAEEGEIEPWDIDIVAVTDAFLSKLEATDLRTSARALFYASVLLRMKGDELLDPSDPDPEEPEPWERALEAGPDGPADAEGPAGFDPVDALEAEMQPRDAGRTRPRAPGGRARQLVEASPRVRHQRLPTGVSPGHPDARLPHRRRPAGGRRADRG